MSFEVPSQYLSANVSGKDETFVRITSLGNEIWKLDLPDKNQNFPLHNNNNNSDKNQSFGCCWSKLPRAFVVFSIKRSVQRLIFRPSLLRNSTHQKQIAVTRNKSVYVKPEIIGGAWLPCWPMSIELTRLRETQPNS